MRDIMSKMSKAIGAMKYLSFEECVKTISENTDFQRYDLLLARRGLEKIYRNDKVSDDQKDELVELIKGKIPEQRIQIENTYAFIKCFIPIGNNILARISEQIKGNFPDSLAVFCHCFGLFIGENPNAIGTANRVVISVAKQSLKNDVTSINYQLSISFENIYLKNKRVLYSIYQEAIRYGVLIEKYDAISFGSEYIEKIDINNSPQMFMKLVSANFEYGLQCGSKYHNYIVSRRYKEEPGAIESFYKCIICKYCGFFGIPDTEKEIAFDFLKRQFANRNQTDLFFFFTGDYQSYVLSVLAYIYTQFLLLFFCSEDTMKIIKKSDIQKNMLWGDIINAYVFDDCYNLITNDQEFNKFFWVVNDGIVIGRWQMDLNLSIVELAKRISLNSKLSPEAGKNSNKFGKEVYEKLVRSMLEDKGWNIVSSSVKIKKGKDIKTDIDLIAYNQGYVIVGQIKFANSGRTRYDIWKAKQSINKAVSQLNFSLSKFSEDKNLLFSILKKFDFCQNREDIKQIIPVVITSSSYFIGEYAETKIPVVSWDMFSQIIASLNHYNTLTNIGEYFSDIETLYSFGLKKEITISEIECNEFNIKYEEYEDDDNDKEWII